MNKKAFQMSVNILVVIILGIVILAAGIKLTTNLFDKSGHLIDSFTEQQKEQLAKTMLAGDKLIAMSPATQTMNRNDKVYFTIGMRNIIEGEARTFYVVVEPVLDTTLTKHTSDTTPVTSEEASAFFFKRDGQIKTLPQTLQQHETDFEPLYIIPGKDAKRGTYTYDAYVCYTGNAVSTYAENGVCGTGHWYANEKLRFTVYIK